MEFSNGTRNTLAQQGSTIRAIVLDYYASGLVANRKIVGVGFMTQRKGGLLWESNPT